MKDELTEQQVEAILDALNEAIETGPWEESNFLRVIGKNLRQIRDNFISETGIIDQGVESSSESQGAYTLKAGQQEIFISLYSSDGSNMQAWERILANLPKQMISRPIYEHENSVNYLIKSKENKINEAYVAVVINQSDLLTMPSDRTPIDKFGKPLLTIKDRALSLDNIKRFIHFSGEYYYQKGRLIKIS